MNTNKWAIIGLGFISSRHIQAIEEVGDKLIVACDIDKKKRLLRVPFFTDYLEMMNSEVFKMVDNVAICTPNYLHQAMVQEALRKHKRVLCEKPLVLGSHQLGFPDDNKVGTVLQLRYHPEVERIKSRLLNENICEMIIRVKRDESYWKSWKGKEHMSGGILFNLGIHYFDILIHLFGNTFIVDHKYVSERIAKGEISFPKAQVKFHIEIMPDNTAQERTLIINGEEYNLSKQDNLSFENLHTQVYKAFNRGENITPYEAGRSINLIEKIIHEN